MDDTPDLSTVAGRIKAARRRVGKHMTQSALAAMLHTHATTISKWECGEWEPKTANVAELAEKLRVPFEWLALGTGDEPAPAQPESKPAA